MNNYLYILAVSVFVIGQIKFVNNIEGITDPPVDEYVIEESVFAAVDENELIQSYVFGEKTDMEDSIINKPMTVEQARQVVARAYSEKYNSELAFSDENIDLSADVTREEFAVMFYNLCADEPQINNCEYITDVEQSYVYFNEISSLYKVGILAGSSNYGHFNGKSCVTPAVAKAMIERLNNPEMRVTYNPYLVNSSFALDYKCVMQNPELPTGCEITSLTSVLNYYGYEVDKLTMADSYLEKGPIGSTDPVVAFIGTPYEKSSYGCYAPVIENSAEKFLTEKQSTLSVYRLSDVTFRNLLIEVEQGSPVIIWASIGMKQTYPTSVWNFDGKQVTWIANEHCLVIYGYDIERNVVLVADPLRGNVEYDIDLFESRYNELLKQAVVIK